MLVVTASRFQYVNWVPQKVEVPVIVSHDSLSLDQFISRGIQPGEEELPQASVGESSRILQLQGTTADRVQL